MKKYEEISIENYCIQKLKCKCNKCNFEFSEYTPLNYELVCFEDKDGKKYFLPTYGKYGYLDLLGKLVEGWNSDEMITQSVTEKFEMKLKEITPHDLSLFHKVKCPNCKTDEISICNRNTLLDYPINWLKIDTEKI